MKKALLKALNIEEGEGVSVALMMAQSFFIGAFIITFQISTNSLFLKEIGPEHLGRAYMISGLLGITLTSIYSFFQKKLKFSVLAVATFIIVGSSTILIWLGFDMEFIARKDLVYIAFLAIGPFIALVAYITFWGVMGRIFSLRQGKRLFGLIDSGQILAMILMSFSIPFISQFMPETKDLMLIGSVSLVLAFLVQFIVSIRFRSLLSGKTGDATEENPDAKSEAKVSKYLKNPYIRMLAMFVFLSMLAQFFVEYSFMKAANGQYPDERDLTSFFGFFMGTLLIFSFVFKVFVYGRLIQMYGLKVNLLILPIILVFFTILASVVGSILGYTPESESYMYFFMFIITSKLFAQSLRVSIEVPAFKILYQPLDKNIRYDVQARIDGFVNELSAFLGGVILTGLELFSFVKLIHFSWLLVPIIGVWMYLTVKLYSKYQSTLRESLTKLKSAAKQIMESVSSLDIRGVLSSHLDKSMENLGIYCIKVARQISPILYEKTLIQAISSPNTKIRQLAWKEIESNNIFLEEKKLNELRSSESDEKCKEALFSTIAKLEENRKTRLTQDQVIKRIRSKHHYDRELLAKLLALEINKDNQNFLADLLKDVDYAVRDEAIKAVLKARKEDLYLQMIENLSHHELKNSVSFAVLELGEEVLEDLDSAFYKSGFDSNTLCRVVDLIGDINGKQSVDLLLDKLTYPDLKVVDHVLVALRKCNFQASGEAKNKITQTIESVIGITMWNYAGLEEIRSYRFTEELEKAFINELYGNFELIFMLLSIIYDPKTIGHIKENIESGTAEGIGFAIELLDIVVDDELKPKLFPVLDDLKPEDRIKALQPFYPRFELSKEQSLKSMMNRSYTEINRWTKACAIWNYSLLKDAVICDDLVAQIFNPDRLLRETAAWTIRKIDRDRFNDVLLRVDPEIKEELIETFEQIDAGTEELLYNKVIYLGSIKEFANLKGRDRAEMLNYVRTKHLQVGEEVDMSTLDHELQVVWKGSLDNDKYNYFEKSTIDNLVVDSNNTKLKAREETVVFEMQNVFELVAKNTEVAEAVLKLSGDIEMDEKEKKKSA